jgi:hypothetical protein
MSGYVPNIPKAQREAELKNVKPVDTHGEHWAQYEKYGTKPAPTPPKNQISLRIGVFFDGTGNNASNSALGALCGAQNPVRAEDLDASCKPYMSDPDSSYGNDITNIRKLSEIYKDDQILANTGSKNQISRVLYIYGVGTKPGQKDSLLGSGTGRGSTGVEGCVQNAFVRIKELLNDIAIENSGHEISFLTFDAFGFSRGAAAARHFANEIVRGKQGPLGPALQNNAKVFGPYFLGTYSHDINMGFIGLFDTVASVAGVSNLGNVSSAITPGINLRLPSRYFRNVVHLVARDEYRANFALSSVSPEHTEITLPGAHSDIGGGYLAEAQECVLVSPMQALTVRQGVDIKNTSIYQEALRAKAKMINQGWPAKMLEIVTPPPKPLPRDPQDRLAPQLQRVFVGLQLKRPVRGELSRVYLQVMYELAKQKGVPFEDLDTNAPAHVTPDDLQSIASRFVAGDYSTTDTDESLLKERYIHLSAHWNNPLGKTTNQGLKLVYINAPTTDGVRLLHPH